MITQQVGTTNDLESGNMPKFSLYHQRMLFIAPLKLHFTVKGRSGQSKLLFFTRKGRASFEQGSMISTEQMFLAKLNLSGFRG
jgi:hypothetical protein